MKLLSVFLFFIAGFSFVYAEAEVQQPSPRMGVAQQDAIARRELIEGNVHYDLFFDITNSDQYTADSTVIFTLNKSPADGLFLDFFGGEVLSIRVNGQLVEPKREGEKLFLPSSMLVVGENKVTVFTRSVYSEVMRLFEDKADSAVYIMTSFEPNGAAAAFACFDQPDIRCSVTTSVKSSAPVVLANGAEISVIDNVHTFAKVDTLSTYLIAFAAGAYKSYELEGSNPRLRVFARASIEEFTPELAHAWLKATHTLLGYFGERFGIPYPYAKLDQFFAPDYPFGAMENPGLMPYTENLMTSPGYEIGWGALVATTAHEMAHIWYGDMVTVKWWDMLPLKESFASYFQNAASNDLRQELGLGFEPLVSRAHDMTRAIQLDNNIHATRSLLGADIHHSQVAMDKLYDDISYPKGASVLWQLKSLVGAELFDAGLVKYLWARKGQSGDFNDFRAAFRPYLSEVLTDKVMGKWAQDWLFSAGVNTAKLALDVDENGLIEDLLILQDSDPISGIHRLHHTEIAFLSIIDGKVYVQRVNSHFYDGAVTDLSSVYRGQKAPDAILLNYGSMDYVISSLDQRSIKVLSKVDVSAIKDPLVRYGIYEALLQNLGKEISADDVLKDYQEDVAQESDVYVFRAGLKLLRAASSLGSSVSR